MKQGKKILAIVADAGLYEKLDQLLHRSTLEVNRVNSVKSAQILAANRRYDLVIVEAALPDLEVHDFLAQLRQAGSPCISSPLLVLATGEARSMNGFSDRDKVKVCDADQDAVDIHSIVARQLGVPARAVSRMLVRVELDVDGEKVMRSCQTRNVSETGMLLRTSAELPLGSVLNLVFSIPGDSREVTGRAEVVRRTNPELEQIDGVGVRFVQLRDDGLDRIRDYVASTKGRPALGPDSSAGGHAPMFY